MSTIAMPVADETIIARGAHIVAALGAVLPPDCVISDPAETRAYECDALTAYRCPPLAVVLPHTTQQVAKAMKVCHQLGVPVVARGAGTSLSGGSLPTADSVVLGTSRLNEIAEIDPANRTIRVGAGVTNLAVTKAVEEEGFFYAPDPSSQLACAISGNIAMNSGGAHCLKYGVTTNNLLGVTLVLADGEIVELGGAHLDAPGYDLLGLICGSEGQLGIVTEATLRILAAPEGALPILIGFDSPRVAGTCVAEIIKAGILPVAIEYMDRTCIEVTDRFSGAGYPHVEALLIVEVEGSAEIIAEQMDRVIAIAQKLDPAEIRLSASAEESALIWKGRKSAFGAIGQISDYMCLDGTVPVSQLAHVLGRIGELSEQYGLKVANVFHAGDGNMHPLILYNANRPGDLETAEALGADILRLCVSAGGCLTGEHGVGIEKRDLMGEQYSLADMTAQMAVKDCFDPHWRLNPAKVFPLEVARAHRGQAKP
jgi:glycolate dehydrogenase FAD-linked subunit